MGSRFYWSILPFVVVNFSLLYSDITIDGKDRNWELLSKESLAVSTGDKLTLKNVTVSKLSASRLVVHHLKLQSL